VSSTKLGRPAPIDLVVDTSAIMAIANDERSADMVQAALDEAQGPVISAASLLELSIVVSARFGPDGPVAVRAILDSANVLVMPVDERQAEEAMAAWLRFGKGHHPAALNYGDCFSYALAHHLEVPLLCVGADFERTDLTLVDVRPDA
jgi:ribonuclease VapC